MNTLLKRLISAACLTMSALLAFAPALPVAAQSDVETEAEATSETTSRIAFEGQLIELSSTDLPTTIVVRKDPEGEFKDYTVEIPADARIFPDGFTMADWITGDSLAVKGELNENTGVVSAAAIQNISLDPFRHKGLNGWITALDLAASTMTVQWKGDEHVVQVTADTKMVVPPKNPAALSDFKVGDRVRLRLVKGATANEARIIVALRRGDEIFLKARTRPFAGTLKAIDEAGKSLTVELAANKHLRPDDVNNLVGVPGEILTVAVDEHTKIVRRFKGSSSLDEFTPGDRLFIVGRVNDDGTIIARLIRNDSIVKAGLPRHLGKITAIDTAANVLTVQVVRKADVRAETKVRLQAQNDDGDEDDALREEVKERVKDELRLKKRFDLGAEWKVTYSDATKIKKDGKEASETDLAVGDIVRVQGVANLTSKTVAAQFIHAVSPDFRPLKRERPLREIVQERIKHAHGKLEVEDILEAQEPEDAVEEEDEAEEELEEEVEDEAEAEVEAEEEAEDVDDEEAVEEDADEQEDADEADEEDEDGSAV
ncbi:hypothetical protein A2856_02490 [Candidatus Uhrbacteria bacterium RIFCSPHIGHO2_01_FULL_63_20]|uniref:DUF5666 domain-containing protein n=1 Tax=Candidatus Uhrbacteria bacterium RIFCSPHIGHO2_01_FULL_63_20 TaxID=1802385 RepID=A0A1F7TKP4_9BACT|nr:MAG: hypothetical protein A2856_02490 [Candidatus Uhrbacteria bacterium RIFCSPHIGHO2_01_FULL_63_20]